MKTIKIIDLLIKIANGEEVPKKIKYDDEIYIYDEKEDFIRENSYICLFGDYIDCYLKEILNDELEIIEDKEIEKINTEWLKQVNMFEPKNVELAIEMLVNQLNKTIDVVNDLKKGK